jgi:hypothetical protein
MVAGYARRTAQARAPRFRGKGSEGASRAVRRNRTASSIGTHLWVGTAPLRASGHTRGTRGSAAPARAHEGVTKRARSAHEAATGAAARLSRAGRPSRHIERGWALAAMISQLGLMSRRRASITATCCPGVFNISPSLSRSSLSLPPHTNTPPIRGPHPLPSPRPSPPPKSFPDLPPPLFCRPSTARRRRARRARADRAAPRRCPQVKCGGSLGVCPQVKCGGSLGVCTLNL